MTFQEYDEPCPRDEMQSWIIRKSKDSDNYTVVYGESEIEIRGLCETIYGKDYYIEENFLK